MAMAPIVAPDHATGQTAFLFAYGFGLHMFAVFTLAEAGQQKLHKLLRF